MSSLIARVARPFAWVYQSTEGAPLLALFARGGYQKAIKPPGLQRPFRRMFGIIDPHQVAARAAAQPTPPLITTASDVVKLRYDSSVSGLWARRRSTDFGLAVQ